MAGHTDTDSIHTAFTARAAVDGYVPVSPVAKRSVVVPAGTWMTSRPRVPLTTS